MPTVRELAKTYQAFEQFSGHHIRSLGLTTSQFDVIATLGNTPGMSCREIGHKTLMVKGTLTGVLDRLEHKGLIQREPHPEDRRSVLVQLTPAGEALFKRVFPLHLEYLQGFFSTIDPALLDQLALQLKVLRQRLESAGSEGMASANPAEG